MPNIGKSRRDAGRERTTTLEKELRDRRDVTVSMEAELPPQITPSIDAIMIPAPDTTVTDEPADKEKEPEPQ
jgi:hypothetical protein